MTQTLAHPPSDATLVAAALAGDQHAFADIYDRYADPLHDFCWSMLRCRDAAADAVQDSFVIATRRLHQLRDPSRLRPWLYAVARSVAMAQLRGRRHRRAGRRLDTSIASSGGPLQALRRAEIRDLLWDAARGLTDRDRVVLDLHVRQRLEGCDLAEALGVTEHNAQAMLSRIRDRVDRALGALAVAMLDSEHCDGLRDLLGTWNGRITPLLRWRVARHVDQCGICDARRRAVTSPWALLGTVPHVSAPAGLRDRVLGRIEARSNSMLRRAGAPMVVASVVGAIMMLSAVLASAQALRTRAPGDVAMDEAGRVLPAGIGVDETGTPDTDRTAVQTVVTEPTGAGIEVMPASLTLPQGGSGSFVIRNTSPRAVTWRAAPSEAWLELSAAEGRISPGDTVTVGVTVKAGVRESTPATASASVTHEGRNQKVSVEVTEPPSLPPHVPPSILEGETGDPLDNGGDPTPTEPPGSDAPHDDASGPPGKPDEPGNSDKPETEKPGKADEDHPAKDKNDEDKEDKEDKKDEAKKAKKGE